MLRWNAWEFTACKDHDYRHICWGDNHFDKGIVEIMPVERTKSLYARTLHEIVFVRRYTGVGPDRPFFYTQARARVMTYTPEQLVGTIQQGDRRAIVFVPDLVDAGFALPVT